MAVRSLPLGLPPIDPKAQRTPGVALVGSAELTGGFFAKTYTTARFSMDVSERIWFGFQAPADFVSPLGLRLNWRANASQGRVAWLTMLGGVVPGSTDTLDAHPTTDPIGAASPVNPVQPFGVVQVGILFTGVPGISPGLEMLIDLYRDTGDPADTCAAEAEVLSATFVYIGT